LEVYCDESDSRVGGHPLLVIAGYVATKEAWEAFSKQWSQRVLSPFGIPYFHSTEIRSKHAKLYRYLSFDQRRELLAAACHVICSHVDSGVAVYMRPHDWNSSTTHVQRSRWGSAYGACMELLLSALSQYLSAPQRVSVFLEGGHVNANDATRRVRNYKHDTEPIEWPECVEDSMRIGDNPPRTTAVRIGDVALVSKTASMPVQAADLLAYLVAAASRADSNPVFEGVLDSLITSKPHRVSGWGPKAVRELVQHMVAYDDLQKGRRAETWERKKVLRNRGFRVYELPWGLAVDKSQTLDDLSIAFQKQVEAIRKRLKDI
jgi:hypothetical protein